MPKLYIHNLTPGSLATAAPVALLYVGTAAEVAVMAEIVREFLVALDFKDITAAEQQHEESMVAGYLRTILGGIRL